MDVERYFTFADAQNRYAAYPKVDELEFARSIAIDLTTHALQRRNLPIYQRVLRSLAEIVIRRPLPFISNREDSYDEVAHYQPASANGLAKRTVGAFFMPRTHIVVVCPAWDSFQSPILRAQYLIHEATHHLGIGNEKQTAQIEFSIMNDAIFHAFATGWSTQYGIPSNFRLP